MTKTIFRPEEVALINARVVLEPPFPEAKPEEEPPREDSEEEILTGPSPAEMQEDFERRKLEWETERKTMMDIAQKEAKSVIEDAGKAADAKTGAAEDEARDKLTLAREEALKIVADAQAKAQTILEENTAQCEAAQAASRSAGFEQGREEGYTAGIAEAQRLVVRTQVVLERLQDKRADILAEAEQQIINLVLLIARKVVKTISENQRSVVIENIREALSKIKNRGKIIIKVNLADLEVSSARLAGFTQMIESTGDIQILEDTSVDPGGCVIETDFGEIDARVANQLAELEARILELSPIKTR